MSNKIETYAVFQNVDKSILAANIFLKQFGYEFVSMNLKKLEQKFSCLFFSKDFQSNNFLCLGNSDMLISTEFYKAIKNSHLFGKSFGDTQEIFFLKKSVDFTIPVNDHKIDIGIAMEPENQLKKFANSLVQQFRLFKSGDIGYSSIIQIGEEKFNIAIQTIDIISSNGNSVFKLEQDEIDILSNIFQETFQANALTELAISNFNLSYSISDKKTRYIVLMICLESLFNINKNQITHTISRHLSLIISNSEEEFQTNYKNIKELYKLRSNIIHGANKTIDDLSNKLNELQDLVRKAINYCLPLEISKKELFKKLNQQGFK